MNNGKAETLHFFRNEAQEMYDMLSDYSESGCELRLEGREAGPEKIVTTCLREHANYMMDFIEDGEKPKRIIRIDFNRIDE